MSNIKKGDFSALAQDYTKYRPGYSRLIIDFILAATEKDANEVVAADIGAGTGIFTKLLSEKNPRTLFAVEPNDNMRKEGQKYLPDGVIWVGAPAENTTLVADSFDLVAMASSFHWPNTEDALKEFDRLLRKGGVFVALWNPRITELSTTESAVDKLLREKYGVAGRVSSGRSGITASLTEILSESGYFDRVAYCESMDVVHVTPEHYLGAWRSVNDIRSQLGENAFTRFLDDVNSVTSDLAHVEVHYLTRAWIAKKAS